MPDFRCFLWETFGGNEEHIRIGLHTCSTIQYEVCIAVSALRVLLCSMERKGTSGPFNPWTKREAGHGAEVGSCIGISVHTASTPLFAKGHVCHARRRSKSDLVVFVHSCSIGNPLDLFIIALCNIDDRPYQSVCATLARQSPLVFLTNPHQHQNPMES